MTVEPSYGREGDRFRMTVEPSYGRERIKKLESGVSVARVCDEYGIKKQTVSDIRRRLGVRKNSYLLQ